MSWKPLRLGSPPSKQLCPPTFLLLACRLGHPLEADSLLGWNMQHVPYTIHHALWGQEPEHARGQSKRIAWCLVTEAPGLIL